MVRTKSRQSWESGRLGDAPLARRICRAGAEGVFRRNAISRESPVHQRQVGGLEPTVAREHVCGPDVISTATVNGAREGARVEIMSVGCPQTAGRYPPNEVSRVAGAMRGADLSRKSGRHGVPPLPGRRDEFAAWETGASEMRPYQCGSRLF